MTVTVVFTDLFTSVFLFLL